MFESLPEISSAVKALALVLFLIAAVALVAWLVRRYTSDRGSSAARGRQPRLAVVDAASMNDGRRKLVIIRRDNVEHLLMIGGPTDVVVEQNIVRAGAPREKVEPALARGMAISETLTRPVPLGEGTAFPLQPETNGRPPRALPEDPMQWNWPAPQGEPRRTEPRLEKPEPLVSPLDEAPGARPTRPHEPSFSRPPTPPANRPASTPPAPAAAPAAEKTEKIPSGADTDQNLAEMASLLESSLRRPVEMQPPEPPKPVKAEAIPPSPAPRAAPAEPKPASNEPKAVFESLEEEMASLLGRPSGKS
jgi:flagellar protein FliO/FliZ